MADKQEHRLILKGSGSGTGTLWVIKDHNDDDHDQHNFGFEDEDKAQIQRKNNSPSRNICHVYKKGFSSGKALGGHMRIHNNQHIPLSKKRKLQMKKQEVIDILRKKKMGRNRPPITCSICGKKFLSKKSLFGHMRCHPDRNWRGIHPPPTELSKAVGGWSVTAKRGRRTNSSEEEEQLREEVHYLMLLAHGHSLEDTGKLETTNTNCNTADKEEEKHICRPIKRMKKFKDLGSIQDASIDSTVISSSFTLLLGSTNNIGTTMDDHKPQLSSSGQIS